MASGNKALSSSTSTDLTITLWIDCKYHRVVYAEAGKGVVDCFLSLLALPLSTVLKLLNEDKNSIGCVANLYQSVQKLDDKYMCHDDAKDALLRPCQSSKLLLLTHGSSSSSNGRSYPNRGGFVEGLVNYIVTDDLKVTPMSFKALQTTLKSFGIKDIGSLKEKTVQLGNHEGIQILKASLDPKSKTVLTDVFLGRCGRRA